MLPFKQQAEILLNEISNQAEAGATEADLACHLERTLGATYRLAQATERESCAKVALRMGRHEVAGAIRARGGERSAA